MPERGAVKTFVMFLMFCALLGQCTAQRDLKDTLAARAECGK